MRPPPASLSVSSSSRPDIPEDIPPPPISPITPTLPPAHLPDATPQQPLPSPISRRPVYTHLQQGEQETVSPPPPAPIDFDTNPDVLALKSAISVLQVQKRRAEEDVQALSSARDAALNDPDLFIQHLSDGKVNNARAGKTDSEGSAWSALPQPQDVVRCPPINWSQYAVVGESLDKLHVDEVRRPSQGQPATVTPDGAYEFTAESPRETHPGVAAPFAPGKDRVDRKPKAKK
ncbi:hypothetical protein CDD80_6916 [Ophiocordyceps camponoti-rufipedis]|uniref:Uncharacterized protein n=1 Tax=Ophiocordyceps camponoti-rufipedis TaxID=2004952 RepID=A0A2C5ZGT2_9HYPO|nr:hypothetical protein CDD80_6916 [Ophiocordyceps camponoti-rufipedis]